MTDPKSEGTITYLLKQWDEGNPAALEKLLPMVYQGLYARARSYMAKERTGHTLSSTALVNEAYLQMVDLKEQNWANRTHFFAVASKIMRHLLSHHGTARAAQKRGGDKFIFTPENMDELSSYEGDIFGPLDEGINKLADIDPRKAQVVELTYFGGFSQDEVSEILDISIPTIKRDLSFSRAWLKKFLKEHLNG